MITKEFKINISTDIPIVDIEIGNNLAPEWIYEKCDVVTLGILINNNAIIIQREQTDDINTFRKKLKEILKDVPEFYSFNISMEKGGLWGFLGEDYNVKEIKPWSGRGWSKNKFFEEISKTERIEDEIKCPFDSDSSKVPDAYLNGQCEEVLAHNLTCLIKEAYIKKYGDKLLEKYKDRIKDGWIQDNKPNFDWRNDPATESQLGYLVRLGCKEIPKTKIEASKLIGDYK